MRHIISNILILLSLSSCFLLKEQLSTTSNLHINKGDIVLTSLNARDVHSINPQTLENKQLSQFDRITDRGRGLFWNKNTYELLVVVDGRDRVEAISAIDGSSRDFIIDGNLNGTIRGMTQLDTGEYLIIESNGLERFSQAGLRITGGGWPLNLSGAGYQVSTLTNGNILVCVGGAIDQVQIRDPSTGALLFSDNGPGGHNPTGCKERSDGTIAVSFNGGTDQVWLYNDDLSVGSAIALNSNLGNIMSNPQGIAIAENDNIYVSDATHNHILELNSNGELIRAFGVLSYASDIIVID
ncbi:MAG: hypothetical protein N4A33_08735 [Bacteriovoracaceae bacterium]|nr:hypothetical protein [Bacteriovoracaceae bacterium]